MATQIYGLSATLLLFAVLALSEASAALENLSHYIDRLQRLLDDLEENARSLPAPRSSRTYDHVIRMLERDFAVAMRARALLEEHRANGTCARETPAIAATATLFEARVLDAREIISYKAPIPLRA